MNFVFFLIGCFGVWLFFFFENKLKTILNELKLSEFDQKRINLNARLMSIGCILYMFLVPTFDMLIKYLFG